MVILVDTPEQRKSLTALLQYEVALVVPLFGKVSAHPVFDSLSVIFVYFDSERTYAIPVNHTESVDPVVDIESIFRGAFSLFTPNGVVWSHVCPTVRAADIHVLLRCANLTDSMPEPDTLRKLHLTNLRTMPIYKLESLLAPYFTWGTSVASSLQGLLQKDAFKFINDVIIPTCAVMERAKIHVTPEFLTYYPRATLHDGFVASQYNPYTITHRVTNRYDSVNYSALDKNSGVRSTITSRFGGEGYMVLIDYESFHLRLIANMIGYELPDEPVHQFLGKQYFNKDTLTEEEYTIGKQTTFSLLYGDNREAGQSIDFFKKIYEFTDNMYASLCTFGIYHVPNTPFVLNASVLENPTPAKAFNYIVQMLESFTSFRLIHAALPILENAHSKIILYTYDSILIDFKASDGAQFLRSLVTALEDGGKYPIRIHAGTNYQDMKQVTHLMK